MVPRFALQLIQLCFQIIPWTSGQYALTRKLRSLLHVAWFVNVYRVHKWTSSWQIWNVFFWNRNGNLLIHWVQRIFYINRFPAIFSKIRCLCCPQTTWLWCDRHLTKKRLVWSVFWPFILLSLLLMFRKKVWLQWHYKQNPVLNPISFYRMKNEGCDFSNSWIALRAVATSLVNELSLLFRK